MLWGAVTVIAILRYMWYDLRCGGRRQVEATVNPEESAAESRNKAAEERLITLLYETTGVRQLSVFGM